MFILPLPATTSIAVPKPGSPYRAQSSQHSPAPASFMLGLQVCHSQLPYSLLNRLQVEFSPQQIDSQVYTWPFTLLIQVKFLGFSSKTILQDLTHWVYSLPTDSLCSPDCPEIHGNPSASASQQLELEAWATVSSNLCLDTLTGELTFVNMETKCHSTSCPLTVPVSTSPPQHWSYRCLTTPNLCGCWDPNSGHIYTLSTLPLTLLKTFSRSLYSSALFPQSPILVMSLLFIILPTPSFENNTFLSLCYSIHILMVPK